jgi:hypothetical protein
LPTAAIEDFRHEVDQLCHELMRSTDHVVLVSFRHSSDGVLARGLARGRDGARPPPDPPRTIPELDDPALLGEDDGTLSFVVSRRTGPGRRLPE